MERAYTVVWSFLIRIISIILDLWFIVLFFYYNIFHRQCNELTPHISPFNKKNVSIKKTLIKILEMFDKLSSKAKIKKQFYAFFKKQLKTVSLKNNWLISLNV